MTGKALPHWVWIQGEHPARQCRGCLDHVQIAQLGGGPVPGVRAAVWALTDRRGLVTHYCQPCRALYGDASER